MKQKCCTSVQAVSGRFSSVPARGMPVKARMHLYQDENITYILHSYSIEVLSTLAFRRNFRMGVVILNVYAITFKITKGPGISKIEDY
jgi:hypothetical protein